MNAWESPIVIVNGFLNTVNESVIGGQSSIGSRSKFGGQLGKMLAVSQEQIGLLSKSSVGTLYAGVYQYVQFNAGDTVPVIGQAAFHLAGQTAGAFIVSTDSKGNFTTRPQPAGIFINVPTAGNYCFIQVGGLATVKYKSGLTVTAATGQAVIVGDDGLMDSITAAGSNVPNVIGTAWTIPVTNDLALVALSPVLMGNWA